MTRPQIIRADTIDLQDHDAPSAKDHNHSASKPSPNATTNGSLAPHQAETIREVEEERVEEEARSPRVSWANGDNDRDLQQYAEDLASGIANSLNGNKMQQQDALAIAQNGGVVGHADDDGDIDTNADDDLDDDMMDKISSSPSIEDGGYTLLPVWPARIDSLRNSLLHHDRSSSPVFSEARSSSPYLELPEHFPLHISYQQSSKASVEPQISVHHLPGEYTGLNEHDKYADLPNHELPYDLEPNVQEAGFTEELAQNLKVAEQDCLTQGRDSGIDLRVENFALNRPVSALDQPISTEYEFEDYLVSPCEFLVPYVSSDEEEEDDFSFKDDNRFIDSGWGDECLRDSEDIDFEFVYALHTFVATVEGQANATKGDTMVLLDDSNSYWWLVRVVKDSSIGYLPAEHIETPTERLARLNKHRNIDVGIDVGTSQEHILNCNQLSATMLGDQAEKTKIPLMTAMRRRKAKTVTFTAPTYVDYSDIDYSDEEGEDDDAQAPQQAAQQDDQQQAVAQQAATDPLDDESAKVEPLKPRSQKQVKLETAKPDEADKVDAPAKEASRRSSDEIFDAKTERTTRNGTVRNTDSFFRDETIETKKITLTPGLLRDDNEARISNDSKDLRQRPSFEKDLTPDKNKDDKKKKEKEKKEKEKKPSAIRSFFSRKDKKKSLDDDDESFGKRSMDAGAGFGDGDMVEEPEEVDSSPHKGPQRNSSKLQKQQRKTEASPTRKPASAATPAHDLDYGSSLAAELKTNNVANVPPLTLRMVGSDQSEDQGMQARREEKPKSAITKILPTGSDPKPLKVTKAKSRVELDDFDSSTEEEKLSEPTRTPPTEPARELEEKLLRPTLPGSFPDSYSSVPPQREAAGSEAQTEERLSESPVQVSPVTSSNPPALVGDTSSQEDRSSPVSSPSPELADADADSRSHRNQDSMTTSTSTTTTSTWNDTNLRAFFDSSAEIRDLLVVVYDKTDVPPAGPDHPIAGSLFREQNAKLAEITTQLDNMLGDWLARKQRLRGTV
ncbi:hypothetical protein F5Y19DRAFT_120699 [Xylariaceae sp. FL1651]|nr:hypothetical protein F5Y19DRAFT_120699 [Xylariaceae sp. FL1651]